MGRLKSALPIVHYHLGAEDKKAIQLIIDNDPMFKDWDFALAARTVLSMAVRNEAHRIACEVKERNINRASKPLPNSPNVYGSFAEIIQGMPQNFSFFSENPYIA